VNYLLILNDPPYGTERSYNGLRLAGTLAKRENTHVWVFLFGDSVACAMAGQEAPSGYYNTGHMLDVMIRHGAEVRLCGACMDARGIRSDMLVDGAQRSNLEQLADWTVQADKVMMF
jgi:uncharacterized protein involved in oxidation of intracellular sulfur